MPTYVYEILDKDGQGTEQYFELVQSMSEKPLKKHPETGEPVRRVPQAPNIAGMGTLRKSNNMLNDNKKLESLGFTKYERKGPGYMERVAGKEGPQTLGGD